MLIHYVRMSISADRAPAPRDKAMASEIVGHLYIVFLTGKYCQKAHRLSARRCENHGDRLCE